MLIFVSLAFLTVLLAGSLYSLWKRPWEALGLPLIFILVCAFEFIVQPVVAIRAGAIELFLTETQAVWAILWPGVALTCFLLGWRSINIRSVISVRTNLPWRLRARSLWNWGLGAATAGLLLEVIFIARSGGFRQAFSQPHGAGLADAENTAYLYMGILWAVTGMAMMLLGSPPNAHGRWRRRVPYILATLLYARAVLLSSRGSIFMTTACLLGARSLPRRGRIRLHRVLPNLLLACLAALLALGYRSVLHLGEYKPETPSFREAAGAGVRLDESALSNRVVGLEFLYHATILATVDATQKYHLGLNWPYYFTVHLIPRVWWPDKPYGFNTPGITLEDIAATTGLVRAGGAAPGLVADLYRNFGVLSALLFYILGRGAARLYVAALESPGSLASVSYVVLYSLSLHLFGQTLSAVLPTFVYAIAPALVHRLWCELARPRHSLGWANRTVSLKRGIPAK